MRKAVGIPKLKAISKGKLCVWKNLSPKSLLNNCGKDDDPHPINGLCEIKFIEEFHIWTLINEEKFSKPKLPNWWKIIPGINFLVTSNKGLFGKIPRPIKTGVINKLKTGISHFRLLNPSIKKVDSTRPNQEFLEKVNRVHIKIEASSSEDIVLLPEVFKLVLKKTIENGQIIFSHIPK